VLRRSRNTERLDYRIADDILLVEEARIAELLAARWILSFGLSIADANLLRRIEARNRELLLRILLLEGLSELLPLVHVDRGHRKILGLADELLVAPRVGGSLQCLAKPARVNYHCFRDELSGYHARRGAVVVRRGLVEAVVHVFAHLSLEIAATTLGAVGQVFMSVLLRSTSHHSASASRHPRLN